MRYPATLTPAPEGGFVVTFRDVPEAITQGETTEEAIAMAADALLTAMDFYVEDRRPVPLPSQPVEGDQIITLPASAWVKVLLLNATIEQKISNAELGRRLGMTPSTVQRLFDLKHTTKLDALAAALSTIGKNLAITIE